MPVDPSAIDGRVEPRRFAGLTYEDFRSMAGDPTLSANEKIGMPDPARLEFDESILADILQKVPSLERWGQIVVDLGSGCTAHTRASLHRLLRRSGALKVDTGRTDPGDAHAFTRPTEHTQSSWSVPRE